MYQQIFLIMQNIVHTNNKMFDQDFVLIKNSILFFGDCANEERIALTWKINAHKLG